MKAWSMHVIRQDTYVDESIFASLYRERRKHEKYAGKRQAQEEAEKKAADEAAAAAAAAIATAAATADNKKARQAERKQMQTERKRLRAIVSTPRAPPLYLEYRRLAGSLFHVNKLLMTQ